MPTTVSRVTSSLDQSRSCTTVSNPMNPTTSSAVATGTRITDKTPYSWRNSRSAAASGGRSSRTGMQTVLSAAICAIPQGNLVVGIPCRCAICGSTPSAHHSWVLSMRARSLLNRKM